LLSFLPILLRKLGVFSLTVITATTEIFIILGFGKTHTLPAAAVLFVAYWSATIILLYCLDILIEGSMSEERETSRVRGAVLAIANGALFLSPMIGGVIIQSSGFFGAYLLGALALLPFIFIMILKFRHTIDPEYHHTSIFRALSRVKEFPHMRQIFALHFLLRMFFSATIIYLPLYLLSLGFAWTEVGVILGIMLVPLVIFEFPIGQIARAAEERVLFISGFLLLGTGVALLSGLKGFNIALFGLVLFFAHCGAAIIEVTSESAFFKRVGGDDADMISLFRILRPGGYILIPIFGTFLIPFVGYAGFFAVLSLVLFLGGAIAFSLQLT
jgi:hypothetical protein